MNEIDIKKIDCHAHPQFPGGPERVRGGTWPTPEEVIAIYKKLNVEKGVVMSRLAPERMHDPITSRDAENISKEYNEHFPVWFCALDPRMIWNGYHGKEAPNFSYYIDFYRERGARGAGEIQANMYIDDKRMLAMLDQCAKKKFPVTIHFGKLGTGCGVADDIGLVRLERVMEEFPDLCIFAHAQSFWSEMGGDVCEETRHGYPTGPIKEEGRIAKLLRKFPNLICDISAGSGYNALTRDLEYSYKFIDEFYEQIVFATDVSSPDLSNFEGLCEFLDNGYINGNISTKAYRAICRDNAKRILNM